MHAECGFPHAPSADQDVNDKEDPDAPPTAASVRAGVREEDVVPICAVLEQAFRLYSFHRAFLLQTVYLWGCLVETQVLGGLLKFAAAVGTESKNGSDSNDEQGDSHYLKALLDPRQEESISLPRSVEITVGVVRNMVDHPYCKDPIAMLDATTKIRSGTHEPSEQFRSFLEQLCADNPHEAGETSEAYFKRQVTRANTWAQNHVKVVTKEMKKAGQVYAPSPLYTDAVRLLPGAQVPGTAKAEIFAAAHGTCAEGNSWPSSLQSWNSTAMNAYGNASWNNMEVNEL
jgi:hypothetical protein